MTAPDTNSTASDNSVFQEEDRVDTPANDPALVQLIKHAHKTAGTTTRRDLVLETPWSRTELDHLLDRLESNGYADVIDNASQKMIVLTTRGEVLARDQR